MRETFNGYKLKISLPFLPHHVAAMIGYDCEIIQLQHAFINNLFKQIFEPCTGKLTKIILGYMFPSVYILNE